MKPLKPVIYSQIPASDPALVIRRALLACTLDRADARAEAEKMLRTRIAASERLIDIPGMQAADDA